MVRKRRSKASAALEATDNTLDAHSSDKTEASSLFFGRVDPAKGVEGVSHT